MLGWGGGGSSVYRLSFGLVLLKGGEEGAGEKQKKEGAYTGSGNYHCVIVGERVGRKKK